MEHVLYHSHCYDGAASAAVVLHYLIRNGRQQDEYKLYSMRYGDELPFVPAFGDVVYLVDYSMPAERIKALAERVDEVIIIDHHQTAEQDLSSLKNHAQVRTVFDMTKSGALLTWETLFPEEHPPLFIQYISDRDLWEFKMPHTVTVHDGLSIFPYDPYKYLHWFNDLFVEELKQMGHTVTLLRNKWVPEMVAHPYVLELAGHPCITVPGTIWFSELCSQLLTDHPEFAMAGYWVTLGDKVQFGLRSRKAENFDVSIVARCYNGGGHKNAAGFTLTLKEHKELWQKAFPMMQQPTPSIS